ncbi:MAG: ATP-binding cassette domain-containing protein [Helicobacter trogontum]|uniref:Dipeptide ABC transporter, ATP-binding protein DppD n=2 Tax=Helicobacter trogontum TaxID=50960 RepID=A0ABQ0D480_9HELI|nr:ATP-binding cassette domain-containing protein [Helicobacter trogontum]
MRGNPMVLALKNLTLLCNDKVLLNDINLEIKTGQTTILFGKSGSGKTLTTLALQGLLPQNIKQKSGELLLDGVPINPQASRAKVFASIVQNPRTCFNPLYSLHTHIKESANALKTHWDTATIESMLHEVGLQKDILALYPFEMSGGMLQRAMIALALLTKAPFLIADEPTTDLDIIVQYRILKLLKRLQKTYGLGILLITHDIDVAKKMGDNFYCLTPCGDIFNKPS